MKDKPLADDVREDLVIMRQNSDRLLNLINQLLDFRKTANNSFTLILSECNIQEIVSGVYIRFTSLARQKNIKLSIDLPEEDISAAVDREALIKIISNLLSNAVKYAATYITITVKYNEATGSFIIKVCNDGSVIPVNMRRKSFNLLFRFRITKNMLPVQALALPWHVLWQSCIMEPCTLRICKESIVLYWKFRSLM